MLFSRTKPPVMPPPVARRTAISIAMQEAGRAEKLSLAQLALSKLDNYDRAKLVRELDRELWREQKP